MQPRKQAGEGGAPRSRGTGRPEGQPSQYLYIGNIPYETSDADLNALFNELEGLTNVRVAIDRNTGWPRGFAHADFESVEAATAAKEKIASRTMGSRTLRADFTERGQNKRDRDSSSSQEHGEAKF